MVGVGVVGYGYWGPNLVRNFHDLEDADLRICCDRDPERLSALADRYRDLRVTTRLEDVMDDPEVEAVVVATPARTHYSLVREALLNGKHTLVEKPLAMTAAESVDLIGIARERNLVLMVGHTFLYSPPVMRLKSLVAEGALGDLRYLYSERLNLGRIQTDINALWSLAPHDISIVLHLLDATPVEVSARGNCYLKPGIEDVAFLSMTFPGGTVANINVSWLDPRKVRQMTIVGSRQMAVYDDTAAEDKIRVFDKRADPPENGNGAYRLHSGEVTVYPVSQDEPLANECRHFIECIRTGARPVSDGSNGLQVVRILEAAQESIKRQGAPVSLAGDALVPVLSEVPQLQGTGALLA